MTAAQRILRGHVLSFHGDPFAAPVEEVLTSIEDGAIAIEGGQIIAVGEACDIIGQGAAAPSDDHRGKFLMPGFVDTHVHYPQVDIIGAVNTGLADWLERYTFPAEMAFSVEDHARSAARFMLDRLMAGGVTTAAVYSTVHERAADIFFEESAKDDLLMVCGKVCMDRNAPDALLDTPQHAYDASKALIERWHGSGRAHYAVTPRFAITSTAEQLEAIGALWAEYPDLVMQTHLSEQRAEIETVLSLFPDAQDYLSVYERFGLVGPGAVFGHAIHLSQSERQRMQERGAAVAHCPTSNEFLSSGAFNLAATRADAPDLSIGLASDVGGGTSLSMFETMRGAYRAALRNGTQVTPLEMLYLATAGGAKVLGLGKKIGQVAPHRDADIIVLDPKATPDLARLTGVAEALEGILMALIMLGDDRAVSAVYVSGERVRAEAVQ
ncbi:MAG: guanine deaminase [Pseudomonadota bacterium]